MNIQSIALVLSLIDLGFPSALVGAVEDHLTAPTLACSVGLSVDKVVIALLDIVLRYCRCMTYLASTSHWTYFLESGPISRCTWRMHGPPELSAQTLEYNTTSLLISGVPESRNRAFRCLLSLSCPSGYI
jgi:hypothetical protein